MNRFAPIALVSVWFSACTCTCGFAQGTFVNLDFEHPNLPSQQGVGQVPFTNALPGWTSYEQGIPDTSGANVIYNGYSLSGVAVDLEGPGSLYPVLQGNYTVGLQGSNLGAPYTEGIGQTGQIPVGSESMQFLGAQLMNLQVTFNGQLLPYTAIGTGPNYTIYGADVSDLAGQTGLLMFSTPPNAYAFLDDIQFSLSPVPEPGVQTLSTVGGALLFGFCARRRKSLK